MMDKTVWGSVKCLGAESRPTNKGDDTTQQITLWADRFKSSRCGCMACVFGRYKLWFLVERSIAFFGYCKDWLIQTLSMTWKGSEIGVTSSGHGKSHVMSCS